MSHCFSCGYSTKTLDRLLALINREDLRITPVARIETGLDINALLPPSMDVEIDDSLSVIPLPQHYRRCFSHEYLKKRGFTFDDYEYFPSGTTGERNPRYNGYVIFPILDEGDTVGYVARHTLSKEEIDSHNRKAKMQGGYRILRFRNSTENDFVKLLYNYDSVITDETETVILCEGIFDVVALTRKLDLYDNRQTAVVATFGKKISHIQAYKLQSKGVKTVTVAYDGDAVEAIKKTATELQPYFRVKIAAIDDPEKDWEDLPEAETRWIFEKKLINPLDYRISKIQLYY
jgi:DNA primase